MSIYINIFICVYVSIYLYTLIFIYIYISGGWQHSLFYTPIYRPIQETWLSFKYMSIHISKYLSISLYTCIYVHIYTYVYIHIYIYTFIQPFTSDGLSPCIDFHIEAQRAAISVPSAVKFIFTYISYHYII
jgi:hypothetical protein